MHRTQLYLGDAQYLLLKDSAAKQNKSIAQLVRECVDIVMNGPRQDTADPLVEVVGMFASGADNVASRADDYLYGDDATVRRLEKEGLVRESASKARKKAPRR